MFVQSVRTQIGLMLDHQIELFTACSICILTLTLTLNSSTNTEFAASWQIQLVSRPTVKHTRSSADTDKSAQRVYVRDEPDKPIRSRIPGPIADIGPVGTTIFHFEKCSDLEIGV